MSACWCALPADPGKLARRRAARYYGVQPVTLGATSSFRDLVAGSMCHRPTVLAPVAAAASTAASTAHRRRASAVGQAMVLPPAELSECHYQPRAPGTWEHAAAQVVRDAFYQRALFMLTNSRRGFVRDGGSLSADLLSEARQALDRLWEAVYVFLFVLLVLFFEPWIVALQWFDRLPGSLRS